MDIYPAICRVMTEVDPIAKARKNTHQGYLFRGIDDFYGALQAVMAKNGIFTVPEVLDERTEEKASARGGVLIYRILKIKYHFYAKDGSSVTATVIGEGQDSGDKASNKAMAVAHKYALMQVFCIPTAEQKDPEYDSPEVSEPAVYLAMPNQRMLFADACKKNNITDRMQMAVLSEKFMGQPVAQIDAYIQQYADATKGV